MLAKRKWFAGLLTVLTACMIGVGISMFVGCSANENTTDISYDTSSSVQAELVEKSGNRYKLVIFGSGKMKDYTDVAETPWAVKAKLIDEVEVQDGVTYIGRNAFRNTKITSLVLPVSVTEIGYDIVDGDVAVCSLGTTAVSVANESQSVYLYSENVPATQDKYWVKDASTGNIVSSEEDASEVQYWHWLDGKATVWEKTKVLFIGNSFTFRNGKLDTVAEENANVLSGGVPRIFDEIASDLGYYVETYAVTGSSVTLATHAQSTSETGAQIELLLDAYDDFDYVVLQEQSKRPVEDYDSFLAGVQALKTKVEDTQKSATVVLYETWGYPAAVENTDLTVQTYERKLNRAYNKVSLACGGLTVVPAGRAFTDAYNNYEDLKSYLWAEDNMHQSYLGAYISACVHVSKLLGGDVRNTSYVNNPEVDATPDDSLLANARKVAWETVNDTTVNIDSDVEIVSNPLQIAVWGRYITEANFSIVLSAYKNYCDDNNIGTAQISYTYYDDATYHAVGDYAAKVNEDNNADILFPVGNNISNSGYVESVTEKSALGVSVFGESGRYIAKCNGNDMTVSFYNWCLTDEAKVIFDSTYVPAGSTTEEPETTADELIIAVWGRYVDEAQFKLLLDAFNAYCTANVIDVGTVSYTYYTQTKVADLVTAITAAGGAGVVFGGGTNLKSNTTVIGNEIILTASLMKDGAANDGRLVSRLDDSAGSYLFTQFCVTEAAVAALNSYSTETGSETGGETGSETGDETGGEDTPATETRTLKIAVWGRYITEDNFKTVLEAFRTYCANNGYDTTNISYTYYIGAAETDTYYSLDAFTAQAKTDGADVIFPAGKNITTGKKSAYYNDTSVTYEALTSTLFTDTSRYIARTNENALTVLFYNWCLGTDGQAVLNPSDTGSEGAAA